MIKTLYPIFQKWSEKGSIYIISDTHFEDSDCLFMDPDWIIPERHIENINKFVSKNDTLIHLGDVGNPEWMKKIKGYKVLIMGNHDQSAKKFEPYFNEIYTGPLIIAKKLILSHEPLDINWAFNVHGHDHNKQNKGDETHLNLASNTIGYQVFNLGQFIKNGGLSKIESIHRQTIDEAERKKHE